MSQEADDDGSIMLVVATNAPSTPRNLQRLAARAGSAGSNGSGDYIIAFATPNSALPIDRVLKNSNNIYSKLRRNRSPTAINTPPDIK